MATISKKTYQFPRNQCIACNDIIHDQNHRLLLFWSNGEAEKIHLKLENFTGITLNAEDPYPKICLPCKFKVESAVGFKNLCVKLREAQEENLSHVKSGRRCEAESSSPSLKRMLSAASDDSESNYCCNPVACKLVPRYRQILPNPTVEKKSLEGGRSSSEESHILSNVGSQNPKVGAWLCFYLFYKPKEARQILINVRLMFNCQNDANIDFSSLLFYNFGNFQTKRLFIDIFPP